MTRTRAPIELWGGVECTVVRTGDVYRDQLQSSGHDRRESDVDQLAALGFAAVRYPVLWERTAPEGLARADWSWSDARLTRLRELGIRPIVGLLHHGSGPRCTSLLDPAFPSALAAYAAAVAARYPWVEDYTPINEPLTTARFSALYGHWYPHARDDGMFARALLNQIRGSVLAMRAIRQVNPRARLVQTEDAGRTFSRPGLAPQARFENARRWLTFDLLLGRVGEAHRLHRWLMDVGIRPEDLAWHVEHTCAPDVVGLNYYLTSDRYLDDRLALYPPALHGGNGRDAYADVEAVRVHPGGIAGHQRVLEDAWLRYRRPVAITEVHAGCTREEQVRWIVEAWRGAEGAQARGVDVRAVTLWALFGAFDWNSLLTRDDGRYEPGAFDVRSTPARPTAIARCARALGGSMSMPVVAEGPGWWRRSERLLVARTGARARGQAPHLAPPVVVTGAAGTLGRQLLDACRRRGIHAVGLSRRDLDLADAARLAETMAHLRPWAVINAAGYVRVDDAERDRETCVRVNVHAPVRLAEACARLGARFVTFSSDLVFDGRAARPYVESDEPEPLNVYGASKHAAERAVRAALPSALVIRTSAFFGPGDDYNFLTMVLRALARGDRIRAAADAIISPTYVPDLGDAALDLLIDGEEGLWHLANEGAVSWWDFASAGARAAGADPGRIEPVLTSDLGLAARRPLYSALGSERGGVMRPLRDAIRAFVAEANWLSHAEFRTDSLCVRTA